MTDSRNQQPELPPGATPIPMEELFQCIGELYLQVHMMRKSQQQLAMKQQQLLLDSNSQAHGVTTTPA